MKTTALAEPNSSRVRDEWVGTLDELQHQITAWAETEGWLVRSEARAFMEPSTGQYGANDLLIETPEGRRLVMEVKGRGLSEAAGRVQLSAWPSLFRVMLLHKPGQDGWTICTDSGIALDKPWNRETFVSLAKDLLHAEQ